MVWGLKLPQKIQGVRMPIEDLACRTYCLRITLHHIWSQHGIRWGVTTELTGNAAPAKLRHTILPAMADAANDR